jgi:AAA family ATP:ADP antiporter
MQADPEHSKYLTGTNFRRRVFHDRHGPLYSGNRLRQMKTGSFLMLAGSIFVGLAVGTTATDSWFLAEAGADNLPLVYLATPIIVVIYTLMATALCHITSMTFVLGATLVFVGAAAASVGGCLTFHPHLANAVPLVFGTKLFVNSWLYVAFTQMWNFISGYIDIHAGKTEFPRLNGAAALGLMIGGGTVALLAQRVPMAWFYFIWAGLCVLSFALTVWVASTMKPLQHTQNSSLDERGDQARFFGPHLTSRYAVLIATSAVLLIIVTVLCEWLAFRQFNVDAMDKARSFLPVGATLSAISEHARGILQQLFGLLGVCSGALVLLVNLFLFSPLVKRVGVGNAILIQPILYASAFTALALAQGFASAVWALLVFQGFFVALDANTRNFLFNAAPKGNRVVIRNFIEGILEPWAAALAGAFLFWGAMIPVGVRDAASIWLNQFFHLPLDWLETWGGRSLDPAELSLIGLVVSAAAFASALLIRWLYPKAIAANFFASAFHPSIPRVNDAELAGPETEPSHKLNEDDDATAAALLKNLSVCPGANDPDWARILRLKGPVAVRSVFSAAHRLSALGLLQGLQRIESAGPISIPCCFGVLENGSSSMAAKRLAIEALAKLSGFQLEAASETLLERHFARCRTYRDWKNLASDQNFQITNAVAEKLRGGEVELILTLLHHIGRIPAPAIVSVALASSDIKEKADVVETLSIAANDPDRVALLVGESTGDELTTQTLEHLLPAIDNLPNAQLPEALAAALVADRPELQSRLSPLCIAMLAEKQFGESASGRWQKRLALASSPLLHGASWEAIEVMAEEIDQPTGNPRGLWIAADAGPHGPVGTCLNPGWLQGQPDDPDLTLNGTEIMELSTNWLGRLALLSPNLPLNWLALIRCESKGRQELFA